MNKKILAAFLSAFMVLSFTGCSMKSPTQTTVKEETTATSRLIPKEREQLSDTCVCCGKPAKELVIWAKAY